MDKNKELEFEMVTKYAGFNRMVRTCFAIMILAGSGIGLARFFRGEISQAIPGLSLSLVALACLLIVKKTTTILNALYLLCFVFLLGQALHMLKGGALYSPSVMWFVAMPVIALALPRAKVIRMAISFIILVSFFYWGPILGWTPPSTPDLSESDLAFRYVITIMAIMAVVLATMVLRSGYNNVFSELREREDQLKKSTEDLRASESKLQQLVQERNSLLRMLTHDLSTPLMSMNYGLFVLKRDGRIDSKSIHRMELALASMEELKSHVQDLIALESGKIDLQDSYTDLRQRLNDIFELMKPSAAKKQVKINFILPDDELWIRAQDIHVKNVFINLLSNGIKFSHPGSVLTLECSKTDQLVNIKIKDSGIGIPEDLMSDLFSFEKKTSRPGTEGEKGTGFGLPLVYNYIQILGGDIKVRSRTPEEDAVNHGTEFEVSLPLVDRRVVDQKQIA